MKHGTNLQWRKQDLYSGFVLKVQPKIGHPFRDTLLACPLELVYYHFQMLRGCPRLARKVCSRTAATFRGNVSGRLVGEGFETSYSLVSAVFDSLFTHPFQFSVDFL